MKNTRNLATEYPALVSEWHPSKNGSLKPSDIAPKSGRKVWWMCPRGHEWQATVASRADGRNCPVCNKESQTSFPEQVLLYYVTKLFPDTVNGDNAAIGKELDIYIPSIRYAIEYDGYHWHRNNKNEIKKNSLCSEKGVTLIRVREEGLPIYDDCICIIRNNRKERNSLNDVVKQVLTIISGELTSSFDVDVKRDEISILEAFVRKQRENSLLTLNPVLASEWHPTKNGQLNPDLFPINSHKRVWWLGKCNHEWQAAIGDRTRGNGCPICAGIVVLAGYNDLATKFPELASEWHPRNNKLLPTDVTARSSRKVWWLGGCGHEWQTTILNRVRGAGCPYCSGNKTLPGFNDLMTTNKEIASEWDYEANSDKLPSMFTSKSNAKVNWICPNGHKWQAKIEDRVNGNGCPVCGGKVVLVGFNDLRSRNPDLAAEWHSTKNGSLSPDKVTVGSSRKVWWVGKCGHEWQARVGSRNSGAGCPYCSKTKVLRGFNDLKTLNPDLALEWHSSRNGGITPESVMPNSKIKVWWRGKCGHEWESTVASRNAGNGCPICSGRSILTGINDLQTLCPQVALEWHPLKNGKLTPDTIARTSHIKVWWRGKCGHEWEDSVAHRTSGRGCPYCSNRKLMSGFNDLQTKNPALASEWHPTKNGILLPSMVSEYSRTRVWWMCKAGHEWETTVKNRRTRNTGCPICSRKRTKSEV